MKQTAVEWLIEKIKRLNQHKNQEEWNKLFELARVENVQLLKAKIDACGGWYKFNAGFPAIYLGGLTLEEIIAVFSEFNQNTTSKSITNETDSSRMVDI